jgi:hypothetical protein
LATCKWCKNYRVKSILDKDSLKLKQFESICIHPKGLKNPTADSTCKYWELDEEFATEHDEVAHDIWAQEQALREGDG